MIIVGWLILFLIPPSQGGAQTLSAASLAQPINVFTVRASAMAAWQKKNSSSFSETTTITRKPKAGHRGPKVIIRAPLLRLEYKIVKKAEDGKPVETSSTAIFQNNDLLQLRIKVNQDGYLHIIQNREGNDGDIVFPDSRIDNGNHFVKKNQEIIIPSHCSRESMDEQSNCWYEIQNRAGNEIYTLIFSREAKPEVLNQLPAVGGTVKQSDILRVKSTVNQITSRPKLSPPQGGGARGHALWGTNRGHT